MAKKKLTLGSLFDGSGGFPLGGTLAGIEPKWSSEIEPFPVLVTHTRLPEVKHYGDVSELSGDELEPVDIITFGSPCFPEGTLILTEKGYVPIEEVEVGMKVLTHMGRWKSVTATGAKYGETVILKGDNYDLECTPNHPIYSRDESGLLTDEKTWTPAGEMEGRLWAVPNSVEALPITIPVYSSSWRNKAMPPFSDDLFYFIGRWLGNGWVYDGQGDGRTEGQVQGEICLCEFADWLADNFGQHPHGKTMPGWIFGLQKSYRESLMRGLLDSEGCQIDNKKNAWRLSTASKRLAESIRLLAEIQGYMVAVHKTDAWKEDPIEGGTVQGDWYSVDITADGKGNHLSDSLHGWYRVRQVRPTNRTKVVYNLTVDEDNSYVADGIVVHNCQDLSIAGKRAGIQDGERSSLFFQAIRIIKEMRRKTNGRYPRYCVWENVPGAFSSNGGEDFKAVLEAVIGVKEEGVQVPAPEGHRWPKADVYLGDGWSVAYRVLDAQYWSVPQRRARIYLVADFGGESAGEILFKSEGLSGDSPQGLCPWQRAAGGAKEGAGETGGPDEPGGTLCLNTQGTSGVGLTEEKSLALVAHDHGNHPAVMQAAGFSTEHSAQSWGVSYKEERSPTLRAGVVPAALMFDNHPQEVRYDGPLEQCPTVTARYGTGGNNQPLVAEPEPVTLKIRGGCSGGGKGPMLTHNKSATLGCNNDQTLFQPREAVPGEGEVDTPAKEADMPSGLEPKAYGISREAFNSGEKAAFNFALTEEVSSTLQAVGPGAVAKPDIRAFGVSSKSSRGMLSDNPRAGFYEADTARTLDCNGGRPDCSQGGICVVAPEDAPGEKTRTFALQGSMIGREDKNGPQGDGINEDVSFTLTGTDRHAVAAPARVHYSASKNSHFTHALKEQAGTLVASDWKDPPLVNDETDEEPVYIVRRLTPTECARLQGFPDGWCRDLAIPDPSEEELSFWMDVWKTWDGLNGKKPKTEKQVRKWLSDPHTDAAEYKLWGNGVALPVVYFVLSGIAWAAGENSLPGSGEHSGESREA